MNPNKEQIAAIHYFQGPSLIIAGAGTGKTFVITNKIKQVIEQKHATARQIVALTFTEKAAAEMEERVDTLLPYGYFQSEITTFHGFADTLLREYGVYGGINTAYTVMSDVDATAFFRRHLDEFHRDIFYSTGNPYGFIGGALSHFSRLRDEGVGVDDYEAFTKKLITQATSPEDAETAAQYAELAKMYKKYEQLKKEENRLDFSDLVFYAYHLLKSKPSVRAQVQKRFTHCFVDEFQDTNMIQYALIKLLFPPSDKSQLTVIGDDNQSIYKFRGASISNILSFQKDYPNAKLFVLNENYRSYQPILDGAYNLIKHNDPDTLEAQLGISKKLQAVRKGDETPIEVISCERSEQEADSVIQEIVSLVKSKKYQFNDCAILVRAHDHATPFIQACERMSVPYQFLGPGLLYFKTEIRDLIAVLRFLANPLDSSSFYRICSMPIFGLTQSQLLPLSWYARKINRPLYEAIDYLVRFWDGEQTPELLELKKSFPIIPIDVREKIRFIRQLAQQLLNNVQSEPATTLVYDFIHKSGILRELATITNTADERRLENITRFYNKLRDIEGERGDATVQEVVAHIDLSLELSESPHAEDYDFKRENAVTLLTVHSSKGLEFPIVFLVSVVSDRFPSRDRREKLPIPRELIQEILPVGDAHIEEERRLFYVGLTRGRDRVYVSYSDLYAGNKRKKKVSPFVVETVGEKEFDKRLQKKAAATQLSIFDAHHGIVAAPEEIDAIKAKQQKRYSYSQVDTYTTCPMQYAYRYILKIPEPDAPALQFGSTIHKALECLYRDVQNGEAVTENDLIQYYYNHFPHSGFLSKKASEHEKERGATILRTYFQHYFADHGTVLAVEQPFTIRLKEGGNNFLLTGKIDRIDKKGSTYEIIDYKTGKMPSEAELKKALQVSLYAIAATDPSLLKAPEDKIIVTYHYLDEDKKYSNSAAERDLEGARAAIAEALTNLETKPIVPIKGMYCNWCSFKMICPAWNS